MTNKEFIIIKQYLEAMFETGYARGCIQRDDYKFGLVCTGDADTFLKRISILLDDSKKETE